MIAQPLQRRLLLLSACALLAACAPATRVVLLPQADGKPSSVTITPTQGQQPLATTLNVPYQGADVSSRGRVSDRQWTAQTINDRYTQVMAIKPAEPQKFVLYFQPGTSDLTPESDALLAQVMAAANARKGGEIVVVGHTDTVGSPQANDALSLQRAQSIRGLLVSRGFRPALVEAVGRGQRELLVPTGQEVDEPRNRRAEVLVR